MQHILNDVFFQYLRDNSASKVTYAGDSIIANTQQVIDFFEEHYGEAISLQRLAKEFHTSPSSLNRQFKKETYLTPIEYLIKLRIRKARHMLRFTNDTIADIAEQCGYENTAYFSNAFKKTVDAPPQNTEKTFPRSDIFRFIKAIFWPNKLLICNLLIHLYQYTRFRQDIF